MSDGHATVVLWQDLSRCTLGPGRRKHNDQLSHIYDTGRKAVARHSERHSRRILHRQ